jgi:hypothetical protein
MDFDVRHHRDLSLPDMNRHFNLHQLLWAGLVFGCTPDPGKQDVGSDLIGDTSEPGVTEPADTASPPDTDSGTGDTATADTGTADTGTGDTGLVDGPTEAIPEGTDPFADAIVSFTPGPDAGFGSEALPDIVLGSPEGSGASAGSADVLSLGENGEIILEMTDLGIVDGPGPDLLVFENPFLGWFEAGAVAVSEDGILWVEWPCEASNVEDDYPGCAGTATVYLNSLSGIDPTDPDAAGGDAFDLADLGMERARFVRIRDTGENAHAYGGTSGGFDLDAIAAANWEVLEAEE